MTRRTAEALIRRLDINRTLTTAGRELTPADLAEMAALLEQAEVEEAAAWREASRG